MVGASGASAEAAHVRALARAVARLADELRATRDQALSATGVNWVSAAAGRYRDRVHEEVVGLTALAGELDDAARLLLAHAAAVEVAAVEEPHR
ncbi:MAG TPA: hypothetical protein VFL99_09695 [Segeticoccus sp.]|uniref:hypothetical protein n=1 Tax=Segeticoccus sp. TaxID=2706531 RepID=UPI002D809E4F|nr:hypothetical protein [Segeticoccus sp.]HET8600587.1 hypothetical protein [Segeticoccus sp.]